MSMCYFDPQNRFVIEDYDAAPPFASFLPGIAGPLGIPLWAFYVNRGQAIAGFGVESKDAPIMEFQPANKAYQTVPYTGFRTFIKVRTAAGEHYYEPFSVTSPPTPLLRGEGSNTSPLPGREGGWGGRWPGRERGRAVTAPPTPQSWGEALPGEDVPPSVGEEGGPQHPGGRPRRMIIAMNELELEETSAAHGLQVNICYFTLPGESFAGLVRQVTVKNVAAQPVSLELLDGLPIVIPYGLNDTILKKMSRTAEAWMAVFNLEAGVPFYRVQASIGDEAEVATVQAGHFYLAFAGEPSGGAHPAAAHSAARVAMIVDPTLVFGANTALSYPDRFLAHSLAELQGMPQVTVGRTPCGFAAAAATLGPDEALTLYAIIGHVSDVAVINAARERLAKPTTVAAKRAEAQALTQDLTEPVAAQTADPRFDAYCRQAMLDNILRGGWPVRLGGHVYHLYGRRHGDLERDYNAFYLPAEFYSQGNASYRDVNQNRRCDVLLNPAVGDAEVLAFLGLIQADGYNPLTVLGSRFVVPAGRQDAILALVDRPDALRPLLGRPFTPGQLLKAVAAQGIGLAVAPEAFVKAVLAQANLDFEAEFGEGFWVDHWFYNLDLLDAYLAVYPDRKDELLFAKTVPYAQSPAFVQPRDRKSVLREDGTVRQYGAVVEDPEVAALMASRTAARNLMRTAHGQGEVFRTTVFSKLVGLALIKFATLDPLGMGIEMEAGKPGWCDALNGLPGLFGSSMSETYELLRLLDFLLENLAPQPPSPARGDLTPQPPSPTRRGGDEAPPPLQGGGRGVGVAAQGGGRGVGVTLPVEQADLLRQVIAQLTAYHAAFDDARDFRYWDAVAGAREAYRARVRLGFDGRTETIDLATLAPILQAFRDKVAAGIARAEALSDGVPPTYFTYEVQDYEILADAAGRPLTDERGRPRVRVKRFAPSPLPAFLEGPVHALKTRKDVNEARALYRAVKESALYDRPLGMYKTNAPLAACSPEIGRVRAFTPGWLENEAIFMHMAYKYLLEVLRAGLHEEFFADMRRGLAPFFDPQVYGRSPLENCSFIVSSAHPDASLHGRGFVARLTGATVEFLTMWTYMTAGPRPFFMREGELCLAFRPTLPDWLFRPDGTLTFTFLGQCTVTYRKGRPITAPAQVTAATLHLADGSQVSLAGDVIPAPYAALVREGKIRRIELDLL